MTKFKTENNSPNKDQVIEKLNHSLADLTNFKLQLKHAHWNVRGINFYQVHLLFDEIAAEMESFIDMVAERITSLGGVANGLLDQALNETCLPKYPKQAVKDIEHVKALIVSLGSLSNEVRDLIIYTEDNLKDPTTADLYTEISRTLDKRLWFLEAHVNY